MTASLRGVNLGGLRVAHEMRLFGKPRRLKSHEAWPRAPRTMCFASSSTSAETPPEVFVVEKSDSTSFCDQLKNSCSRVVHNWCWVFMCMSEFPDEIFNIVFARTTPPRLHLKSSGKTLRDFGEQRWLFSLFVSEFLPVPLVPLFQQYDVRCGDKTLTADLKHKLRPESRSPRRLGCSPTLWFLAFETHR